MNSRKHKMQNKSSFAVHPKSHFWHPIKNGDLEPDRVPYGSNRILWFFCNDCHHEFQKSANAMQKAGCPYCSITKWKHCGDNSCEHCFKRSFASVPLSKHWHPKKNGLITPFHVARNSDKKCWLKCDSCGHDFQKVIKEVTRKGSWCPYCSTTGWNHCGDYECKPCFNRSFISSPKATFWHDTLNNATNIFQVSKRSAVKHWFACEDCSHNFQMSPDRIYEGDWCVYCSKANWRHCGNEHCILCFDRSFASHPKAQFWHQTKNGDTNILHVAKHAKASYWFTCNVCEHDIFLSRFILSLLNRNHHGVDIAQYQIGNIVMIQNAVGVGVDHLHHMKKLLIGTTRRMTLIHLMSLCFLVT